jgi:hypothetical protein
MCRKRFIVLRCASNLVRAILFGGKGGPLDYPPGYTLGAEVPTGPLMLKGHGGPMAFRNLRITAKK